jgi:hypothetical protein
MCYLKSRIFTKRSIVKRNDNECNNEEGKEEAAEEEE